MSDAVARARELLAKATPGPWEERRHHFMDGEWMESSVVPVEDGDFREGDGDCVRINSCTADAELEAVVPTLKAGDVVEVKYKGHTATGELWAHSPSGLSLWSSLVRTSDGNPGPYVDALRIIERAPEPEPGADIHFEVVAAAGEKIMELADEFISGEVLRAALAAADAKRAELEGEEA